MSGDAENSNSSSDGQGRGHGVCTAWSFPWKGGSACRWAFGVAVEWQGLDALWSCQWTEGVFPPFTCSRTGFPRWTPGRFCVLAVSPLGHSQGLPCYGLEAWMRSGSPACSCITNWSVKGWNTAQRGSEIQDRHAWLLLPSQGHWAPHCKRVEQERETSSKEQPLPVCLPCQEGKAEGETLHCSHAHSAFSWMITDIYCIFNISIYAQSPSSPSALPCSFSYACAWMDSPQWQRW